MGKTYTFKVNGIEITVEQQRILAKKILKLAREKDAIPRDPDNYTLQGEKGLYDLNDEVGLELDSLFIAIPNVPTQVA